jgi:hypothetical protein
MLGHEWMCDFQKPWKGGGGEWLHAVIMAEGTKCVAVIITSLKLFCIPPTSQNSERELKFLSEIIPDQINDGTLII